MYMRFVITSLGVITPQMAISETNEYIHIRNGYTCIFLQLRAKS